jgi:hypothetical protein
VKILLVGFLVSQDACVGRDQRAVEGGGAVHVLGGVLQVPLTVVLVHRGENRDRLQTHKEREMLDKSNDAYKITREKMYNYTWKRRHPILKMRGSLLLRMRLCQR